MFERDKPRGSFANTLRERLPFVGDLRTAAGRAQLAQRTRAALFRVADGTVRAVSAGMGIADVRALFRGEPLSGDPDPREQILTNVFIAHLRPRDYARSATKFSHTFGFGFFSVLAFVVAAITGALLAVWYVPSVDRAYPSTLKIVAEVPFGALIRNVHAVGATLMVLIVALHLLRVYFTGAFKHPRQFTWVIGVVLLLLTLGMASTGALLPWDQTAYWSVSAGVSIVKAAPFGDGVSALVRGGAMLGQDGLTRFYLAHVLLLPLATMALLAAHYYRVARVHGISLPAGEEESPDPAVREAAKARVDYLPEIFTRELLWISIGVCTVLFIAAFALDAPLGQPADPFRAPAHVAAPWYWLWLQGMLKDPLVLPLLRGLRTLGIDLLPFYDSAFWQGVALPTVMFLLLLGVPYIDEFWMRVRGASSSRLAENRQLGICVGLLALGLLLLFSYFGTPFFGAAPSPAVEIADQYLPAECERAFIPLLPDDCGAVRRLGYANLPVGVHDLAQSTAAAATPDAFQTLLAQMQASVQAQRARGLADANGALVVEEWQTNLKRVTLRLTWSPQREGDAGAYERVIYLHKDR